MKRHTFRSGRRPGLCDGNCSFVSGEASATFWMMSFVFLAPRDLRMPVFLVVAVLTVTLSLNRVAFGGHFLSDVILSWCLTLFVLLAMKALILDPCRRCGEDPYDAFLVRLGRHLTAALDRSRLAR